MKPCKGPLVLRSYLTCVAHLWSLPRAYFFSALTHHSNCREMVPGDLQWGAEVKRTGISELLHMGAGRKQSPGFERQWGITQRSTSPSVWCWEGAEDVCPHDGAGHWSRDIQWSVLIWVILRLCSSRWTQECTRDGSTKITEYLGS